jgi:hypothetical protein
MDGAIWASVYGCQGKAVGPMKELFKRRPGYLEGTSMSAAEFASMVMASMRLKGATHHEITTPIVEFTGERTAKCSAYLRAIHFTPDRPTAGPYEVGGEYRHDLELQEDGWRIAYWRLAISWEFGDYAVMSSAVPR